MQLHLRLNLHDFRLSDFLFVLMVIGLSIAPNTLLGYCICFSFILYITWINKSKYRFTSYFFIELALIIYLIIQLIIGVSYPDSQLIGIRLLVISLIFNLTLYQYIMNGDYFKIINLYAIGNIIGDFILLVFYFNSIFNAGGLTAPDFIGVGLFKIGGVAAVNIGWVNVVAIVLLWPTYLKTRSNNILIKTFILLFFALLTGRRKIFLFIISSVIIGTYVFYSKNRVQRKIKGLFIGLISLFIGYLFVMKIPILYNFIGKRLMIALSSIFDLSGELDSSINMRNNLVNKAIIAWSNNKLFGQGYNAFSLLYNDGGYYSHNNYYEILVSFGVIGLVIYYMKYFVLFMNLIFLKIKKLDVDWYIKYYIINLLIFCFLEYYQITFMYRSLTIFLIFILCFVNKSKINLKRKNL